MKTSSIIGLLAIAVVVLGGGYWFMQRGSSVATNTYRAPAAVVTTQATNTTVTHSPQTSSSTVPVTTMHASTSTAAAALKTQSFSVTGSDTKASLTSITVAKGTPVTITFTVDANNTYHGGLDFRSSVISTGTILPGKSKSVSFTATTSFAFTPYWPATNTKKPYVISVLVK
jgi:cytoskeletal protein RodZ